MTELLMLKVPLGAQESRLHLTSQTGLLVRFFPSDLGRCVPRWRARPLSLM